MSLNRSTVDNVVYDADDQVSPMVYVAAAIALGFIGFFGFTMNLLVAIVIVKDAQILWTPVNVILVNLVVRHQIIILETILADFITFFILVFEVCER